MAQEFSFDVVSKVDLQAADNAVNSANREIATRFDFKNSVSRLELNKKDPEITLFSDDENKLKSVVDILQGRLTRQGIDLKALDWGTVERAEGATVRQKAKLVNGIATEKAKEMVRAIKDAKLKVTPSIQAEQVRVTSRSKDELQSAMALLKAGDFDVPIQFSNFR